MSFIRSQYMYENCKGPFLGFLWCSQPGFKKLYSLFIEKPQAFMLFSRRDLYQLPIFFLILFIWRFGNPEQLLIISSKALLCLIYVKSFVMNFLLFGLQI